MECKVISVADGVSLGIHWNISRMECKGGIDTKGMRVVVIGIYPEWNVKVQDYKGLLLS